jgi:hypothetical protein
LSQVNSLLRRALSMRSCSHCASTDELLRVCAVVLMPLRQREARRLQRTADLALPSVQDNRRTATRLPRFVPAKVRSVIHPPVVHIEQQVPVGHRGV